MPRLFNSYAPPMLRRAKFGLMGLCFASLLVACSPDDYPAMVVSPEPIHEAPVVIDSPAEPVVERTLGRASTRTPRPGVLTAGDIDDTRNYGAFRRYLTKTARATGLPEAKLTRPVLAQLTGPSGAPAPGVHFTLRRPGAAEPFYSGYSGVDGHITVFPALHAYAGMREVELRAFPGAQGQPVTQRLSLNDTRQRITLPFAKDWSPEFLDLAFVVDTTGSMADELEWLTKELRGIVRKARASAPGVNIRYGLVVYRDHGDDYVVRNYGFTKHPSEMAGWLRKQRAAGGGDYPEAASAALAAGVALNWRRGNGERLLFHIADAPPHDKDARAYLAAARQAARSNVQIFGLGASGVATESEFLMRQAALQTAGRYLFLTDDSGVGYGHAEPTISCYKVTQLNHLMQRVLQSELSGRRVEPKSVEVIRSVGTYQSGTCSN